MCPGRAHDAEISVGFADPAPSDDPGGPEPGRAAGRRTGPLIEPSPSSSGRPEARPGFRYRHFGRDSPAGSASRIEAAGSSARSQRRALRPDVAEPLGLGALSGVENRPDDGQTSVGMKRDWTSPK
jgi:hypothetical protein